MPYIAYSMPKANGVVYATLVESHRSGSKVTQKRIENLGRVLNKEKGIFQNRKRGIFCYTVEKGISTVDSEQMTALASSISPTQFEQEKLILDFGDSYILDKYIQKHSILEAIKEILPIEHDTLFSLLFYRILTEIRKPITTHRLGGAAITLICCFLQRNLPASA